LIEEIASREGCSIKVILDSKELKEVLKSTTLNKPQRTKTVVNMLKSRRFPSILRAEKIFNRIISNLSLPLSARIIPPPFFEGVDYRLEIIFKNGEELKGKLADLYNLEGLEKITDFWEAI